MNKRKQIDPIPEEFSSLEDAADFWDTHDTTDYPQIFRTVSRGGEPATIVKHRNAPSVVKLAGNRDPVEVITEKARNVVFKALEEGWSGPPFDPFKLAEILGIKVLPRDNIGDSVDDARINADRDGRFQIEYNLNKPAARVRFSICHEIAHTFFPNCAESVRYRLRHGEIHGADRQVEMLCNLAAAELLMPIGSFYEVGHNVRTIDDIIDLRKQFEVSTEAVLLRSVKLSKKPMAAIGAVVKDVSGVPRYVVEYCVNSKNWNTGLRPGQVLPEDTALKKCVAVGYTSKGSETWTTQTGDITVEAVGLPPYPGPASSNPSDYFQSPQGHAMLSFPRVVGFIRPNSGEIFPSKAIVYLKRDATIPVSHDPTIIAHIANDKTPNWGAGFGRFLSRKWPHVQDNFRSLWLKRGGLPLGSWSMTLINPSITVFHMVAQHGYGPSPKPLIRYERLRECLQALAELAVKAGASVQMPRIGAGEAGGSWPVIEEMIQETIISKGVRVTVCDLPDAQVKNAAQLELVEQTNQNS